MDEEPPTSEAAPRGHAGWAWLIILGCTLVAAWSAFAAKQSVQAGADGDRAGIQSVEMEGRLLIGQAQLGIEGGTATLGERLDELEGGRFVRRLRVVILSAELESPEAARERLRRTSEYVDEKAAEGVTILDSDRRTETILRGLYGEGDASVAERADAFEDADREHLAERLGWIGRLATLPEGSARPGERAELLQRAKRGATAMLGFGAGICCGSVLSLLIAVGLLTAFVTGKLAWLLPASAYPGGVLAETFAAWFLVMTLPELVGMWAPSIQGAFGIGAFLFGFLTLAYGRIYGLSFAGLRQAIGLHRGAGFWREAGIGVVGCFAAVPIVFVGFLGTLALSKMAEAMGVSSDASHPIVMELSGAGTGKFLLLFVAAAIVAPLVEETFFRGVLYRHLRGATGRMGRVASVIVSALATSLVFAAVHPQSWVAIPALGALGFAFALLREWRGSLVAPMVAHALWNGTLVSAGWLVFG